MISIALVGRTSVGKSTLFNRIIGRAKALTSELPHTTRDRNTGETVWRSVNIRCIDTGGIEEIQNSKSEIDENDFGYLLDTGDLPYPDPDLVIRTGGEKRLSGFMLWQTQYSELVFSKKFLPDYTDIDFENTIKEFSARQRRFGK